MPVDLARRMPVVPFSSTSTHPRTVFELSPTGRAGHSSPRTFKSGGKLHAHLLSNTRAFLPLHDDKLSSRLYGVCPLSSILLVSLGGFSVMYIRTSSLVYAFGAFLLLCKTMFGGFLYARGGASRLQDLGTEKWLRERN